MSIEATSKFATSGIQIFGAVFFFLLEQSFKFTSLFIETSSLSRKSNLQVRETVDASIIQFCAINIKNFY